MIQKDLTPFLFSPFLDPFSPFLPFASQQIGFAAAQESARGRCMLGLGRNFDTCRGERESLGVSFSVDGVTHAAVP